MLIYSNKNHAITGEEGLLFSVPLNIACGPGTYNMDLQDILVTYSNLSEVSAANASGTITVAESEVVRYGENQIYVKDITINHGENALMLIGYNSTSEVYEYSAEIILPTGVDVTSVEFQSPVSVSKYENEWSFTDGILNVNGAQGRKGEKAQSGDKIIAKVALITSSLMPGEYTIYVDGQYLSNDDDYFPEDYTAKLIVNGEIEIVNLVDGTPYTNDTDKECSTITYTRNFSNTAWKALYLPFDMDYEDWSEFGDIARFNNVYQYDTDGNGIVDSAVLSFERVTTKVIANTPYVFRPKEAGEVKFSVNDATLKAAPSTDDYVERATTENVFTIYGTYTVKEGLFDLGAYAISPTGQFVQAETPSQTLNPYRIYMVITDRGNGSPIQMLPMRVSILVDGDTTGTEDIEGIQQIDDRYYDLLGRPVVDPQHGVYINGGEKIIIR